MRKFFFNFPKIYKFLVRKKKVIVFFVVVVIFVPIIIYGLNYTSPSTNKGTINSNTTLIFANTVYSLEPSHYTDIHFSLENGTWNLIGSITSSTSVFLYILNQSGFSNLTQGKTFNWVYETFANSGANVNVKLKGGSYFLVFYNQNTVWGVGVEITSNFILSKN